MKLDLNDLQPVEAQLLLSGHPGKVYVLKKFSLAAQIWMKNRFGKQVQSIFSDVKIPEMCETVHYLLKDKKDFPTFTELAESIITHQDKVNVVRALLACVGVSQPIVDKIARQAEEEKKSRLTGQDSSTSSPANTDGPSISS